MKKISRYQVIKYLITIKNTYSIHQEYLFYSYPLYNHFITNVSTILLHNYLSFGLFY